MYKAAAVLSVLMKVYTIRCHDRCHINVMLVLQSCADPLHVLPNLPNETFSTSSGCTHNAGSMEGEADVDVIEESFIAVNKEADIVVKQEEIPGDVSFFGSKAEPDVGSCVCVIRQVLHEPNFFVYVGISVQLKQIFLLSFFFFLVGVVLGGG
jgi:hypothetical protein